MSELAPDYISTLLMEVIHPRTRMSVKERLHRREWILGGNQHVQGAMPLDGSREIAMPNEQSSPTAVRASVVDPDRWHDKSRSSHSTISETGADGPISLASASGPRALDAKKHRS